MSEFVGLWKHENTQHALVPPNGRNVAAEVAEELKTVTYATLPMEERRNRKKLKHAQSLSQPFWLYSLQCETQFIFV